MHYSSFLKAELFVKNYVSKSLTSERRINVIEVGSKSYEEQDTFKSLFADHRYNYTGLDVEPGKNVDIVPKSGYVWSELADDTYDVAISGQTFEHNPFFWVTFCEMARILKPGGRLFVIAPGGGPVHRYPYDCWRFYPDAWGALCALSGMDLVETYFEKDSTASQISGGIWRDSSVIATKPTLSDPEMSVFNERLKNIVSPFKHFGFELGSNGTGEKIGPAFNEYFDKVSSNNPANSPFGRIKRMLRNLRGKGVGKIYA
jgi:SAM-dependent methyltransferase